MRAVAIRNEKNGGVSKPSYTKRTNVALRSLRMKGASLLLVSATLVCAVAVGSALWATRGSAPKATTVTRRLRLGRVAGVLEAGDRELV